MTGSVQPTAFRIAGFVIHVFSNATMEFEMGFSPFLLTNSIENAHIFIEVIPEIPKELLSTESLVFEAQDGTTKLWDVCSHNNEYKIIAYNPKHADIVQQVAIISPDTDTWTIYCNADENNTANPFAYPMGPLILYFLTVKYNAIMIHSSGIIDGDKGRLFSGFSGVGKSTMAGIWHHAGHTVINDDRLILTIGEDAVTMHNSPMFYEDVPKQSQLHAIYLLKQTPENCIRQLSGAEAISRVMAFCIQHGYDKRFIEHHLATITKLYQIIPIFELGFKPDADIIEFIRKYE